ncbi:Youth, involved in determining longevity [Scheffersomyces stipitis CBS 6054]|uniref:Youth, involved in determining longevity n=1 Tax=Scheffersomyces stipitis (strain ATCC 58785 / CBS 6054 / NBRC 10063 / NRRL Y-11545) TaxID=322104 RepID=A3GHJ7_PICST|nr:Youth, involved in determining longevity [Scheffersomyces stipitis CBS 6054]EAZ62829.1 Youth, involved in determining longevity [Scheffersomyces stipitis CBS 6054]KAG2735338.1 hypothetical protein G9P44_001552 [Scheffersomyces stipitis]
MLFSNFAILTSVALSAVSALPLQKRGASTCSFPTDAGLVSITPDSLNAGWAMSPDQACTPGKYCPYACPPGKVAAQWDPSSTSYTYPQSMNGGLYCNADGTVSKPFSDRDYCVDSTGSVEVNNKASANVAFCQTVLPGNEAMLIPTNIKDGKTKAIAVPGSNYWAQTSAHFYVNAPGVSTTDGCVWGSKEKPEGNWAPYVAGTNTDSTGLTYVKLGWNPIYVEDFNGKQPNFGLRVTCDNAADCVGSCEIDPSKDAFNTITGSSATTAGGSFCVVTVKNNASAKIEVFEV